MYKIRIAAPGKMSRWAKGFRSSRDYTTLDKAVADKLVANLNEMVKTNSLSKGNVYTVEEAP